MSQIHIYDHEFVYCTFFDSGAIWRVQTIISTSLSIILTIYGTNIFVGRSSDFSVMHWQTNHTRFLYTGWFTASSTNFLGRDLMSFGEENCISIRPMSLNARRVPLFQAIWGKFQISSSFFLKLFVCMMFFTCH